MCCQDIHFMRAAPLETSILLLSVIRLISFAIFSKWDEIAKCHNVSHLMPVQDEIGLMMQREFCL